MRKSKKGEGPARGVPVAMGVVSLMVWFVMWFGCGKERDDMGSPSAAAITSEDGGDAGSVKDAGDGGVHDAGLTDAGSTDAGIGDAGAVSDAGAGDAGGTITPPPTSIVVAISSAITNDNPNVHVVSGLGDQAKVTTASWTFTVDQVCQKQWKMNDGTSKAGLKVYAQDGANATQYWDCDIGHSKQTDLKYSYSLNGGAATAIPANQLVYFTSAGACNGSPPGDLLIPAMAVGVTCP